MKIFAKVAGLLRKRVSRYIMQKGIADIAYFAALGVGTFLASRFLSQGEFGYYATFLIILNIFIAVFDFGFRHSTIKFISSEDDPVKKKQIARFANAAKFKYLLVLTCVLYPIILLLRGSMGDGFFLLFMYLPITGIFKSMALQFDSVLRARNMWVKSGFLLNLQPVAFMLLLLTFVFSGDFSLKACLNIYLFTNLLGFCSGYVMTYRCQDVKAGMDLKFLKRFVSFGLPLAFNGVIWAGSDKIDKFVIFKHLPLADIGSYNVAYFVLRLISQVNSPIQSVLFTHFSNVDSAKGTRQIRKYYYFTIAVGLAITLFLWGFSDFFFRLLYGSKYLLAPIYFRVLLLSLVVKLSSVPLSYFIIFIEGKTWKVGLCQGMGFLTNLTLSLILIPQYGGIGAALAVVLSYVFIFVGYSFFILSYLKGKKPRGVPLVGHFGEVIGINQ